MISWAEKNGITIEYIQPGKPQQNAYIERYNRTVRYDWLNQYFWVSIEEVQDYATQWIWLYNNERPNMALGGFTPKQQLAMAAEYSTSGCNHKWGDYILIYVLHICTGQLHILLIDIGFKAEHDLYVKSIASTEIYFMTTKISGTAYLLSADLLTSSFAFAKDMPFKKEIKARDST